MLQLRRPVDKHILVPQVLVNPVQVLADLRLGVIIVEDAAASLCS